jgi:N-acetylmuramoyl-L-alanine amidase
VIARLLLLAGLSVAASPAARAPSAITVTTARGERRLPVRFDSSGAPVLAAGSLVSALNGTARLDGAWAAVTVSRQEFRFLLGAPFYTYNSRIEPLAGAAFVRSDTLFVPLQFVSELLPRLFGERYRYDGAAGRLVEQGARPSTAAAAAATATAAADAARLPNGLKRGHIVAIDPGHGGVDPGNPGMYFPRGTREKDVTLQVGLLLRDELRRRGVGVRMTRVGDTLIALGDRGGYCSQACDLFVSLHVNSLPRRPKYTSARGFETYFLAEAKTEEAARVAKMENEAVRFEASGSETNTLGGLDFILKDLQMNEHLRESARAAELVQTHLDVVHGGTNRGVKQAGFMVLTTARRPAILVEMGYSTNPEDGRLLTARASQRTLATALADAVVAYLREYDRKTGGASQSGGGS